MGADILIGLILIAVGFGLGRVHNAGKVKAQIDAAVAAAKKL